jgi:hypothetical protein
MTLSKFDEIIGLIKEDVNKEDGITLSLFNHLLKANFKLLLLIGIPVFFYLILSFGELG